MTNLHQYYKDNKDAINASIMKLACDLAVGRLVNAHGQPFEAFVEPDNLDDPESGTHYKKEFHDVFNRYYDEEYARIAALMKFDFSSDDGVAHEAIDSKPTYATVRFDIESVTDAEIMEETIDEVISNTPLYNSYTGRETPDETK